MIINSVTLANFGLYGGKTTFDLRPQPQDGFNRPIVLVRGKNGTGKTTLIEAIRLCLHGPLALGSRVSRAEYEAYLARRIHVPANPQEKPTSAEISLALEHVSAGRKHSYQVERSWQQVNERVKETLSILEDGQDLADVSTPQQQESFLRELVPPSLTDIFFFDGEKLQMLADDETSQDLLAETVKTLLGVHLVEQLQKDLDVFLSRQEMSGGLQTLQRQLAELTQEKVHLEQERLGLRDKQQANQRTINQIQRHVARQEQEIANQGSWFAEQLEDLKATQQHLMAEIELQRRKAQELANGLLPFAITPKMTTLVAERLGLEKEYEIAVSAQQTLAEATAKIAKSEFWAEFEPLLDEETQQKLRTKLETTIQETAHPPTTDPNEIILRVSEQGRRTLLTWIEQTLAEVPRQFCQTVSRLNALEVELARVGHELTLVPSDETLKPLVETLQSYNQELGALRKVERDLDEQHDRLTNKLEQLEYQQRAVRQQIADHQQHNRRVQLASRTHRVLEDYAQALNQEKVARFERIVTRRFNDLSRKADLIEAVKIDPHTFKMTLFRKRQPFERKQLSAGEKQILAIATIWALREASGVPMPVILDTPLGRLDRGHRLKMIEDYFPQASHQVILLATDAEIDEVMEAQLKPAISHSYDLTQRFTQHGIHPYNSRSHN
jgi:DNA sulfur modification protein DndD